MKYYSSARLSPKKRYGKKGLITQMSYFNVILATRNIGKCFQNKTLDAMLCRGHNNHMTISKC